MNHNHLLTIAVIGVVAIIGLSSIKSTDEQVQLCLNTKAMHQLIAAKKLQTLMTTWSADGHVHETLLTPLENGEIVVVDYDSTVPDSAREYCVESITNYASINPDSVELLYEALERLRGKRA